MKNISTISLEELPVLKPNIELRIAEYRAKTGQKIEQQEIAKLLGVTKQYFNACVNGRASLKMDKAFKLAHILQCKVDDLYIYEEE